MFGQNHEILLQKEYLNKQSDYMSEAAHQSLVYELKQGQQDEVANHRPSLRYFVGATLLKIGGRLIGEPSLKEA